MDDGILTASSRSSGCCCYVGDDSIVKDLGSDENCLEEAYTSNFERHDCKTGRNERYNAVIKRRNCKTRKETPQTLGRHLFIKHCLRTAQLEHFHHICQSQRLLGNPSLGKVPSIWYSSRYATWFYLTIRTVQR